MAPPIVWIIVVGYFTIGLFLFGVLHKDPSIGAWFILLWPAFTISIVFFAIISAPYYLGVKLSELLEKRKNRGDK